MRKGALHHLGAVGQGGRRRIAAVRKERIDLNVHAHLKEMKRAVQLPRI